MLTYERCSLVHSFIHCQLCCRASHLHASSGPFIPYCLNISVSSLPTLTSPTQHPSSESIVTTGLRSPENRLQSIVVVARALFHRLPQRWSFLHQAEPILRPPRHKQCRQRAASRSTFRLPRAMADTQSMHRTSPSAPGELRL